MDENAVRFAENLMQRYPKARQYPYTNWCYPQGLLLWGFIRLYENTGRQDFYNYILTYCDEQVTEEGKIIEFKGDSLDDIMAASVIVWAYSVTKKDKYRKAAKTVRKTFDDYPRNSDGGFWHGKNLPGEMWVDGVFMGLMFLARYGKYLDETDFSFRETVRQLNIIFERCQKDKTGLLYHAYSEDGKAPWAGKLGHCSPEIWSEGLGWYAMILVEALGLLPEDYSGRESVEQQLILLCRDLIKVQDEVCGLWYQVVDKPGFPRNFYDTSGSAMFVYTLKKALDMKLIQGKSYEDAIQKGYIGILSKCTIGMDGYVHVLDACNGLCVQKNYDIYVDYTRTVDAQEAVAAVLWALTAVETGTSLT